MRIGILSDTHDRLPVALFDALEGVDELLHAGDITRPDALTELEAIAPVTAVRGNCDGRDLGDRLPEERLIERDGVSIALIHGHTLSGGLLGDLIARYRLLAPDLVIFGHTHDPLSKVLGPTHYFNPGTAGGIGSDPTAAILETDGGRFTIEHVPLR